MDNHSGHVMNLANSIIGVSVLAMPYCFKQCGIILSLIMLLISSVISRLACHFLLKSAIIARRKTFEFLAFYIFGAAGKFAIEVGIIGFLLGTCIAFFVVMGDLGPEIVAEMTGAHKSNTMRTSILMALALFCVLPLGLLRNVDSLNGVSKATIAFYCCLVLKIVFEATPHIVSGDWYQNVVFWRPAGIMQCLPIFSMALFCQTQLFEIYQSLQNATLEKMNNLVRLAVNICTLVYIFVGVFGYIAFAQKPFSGNILLSFSPSFVTDVMKIGFVLSVAFSFPLVIFPCRASLYSLLYKEGYTVHEGTSNYIPEGRFKTLTMIIVFISLIIGIMIPNIELVLGLVGSTIGVMICVLFPVACFICISPKNTNERILAQLMLMVGVFVMVLGTYKNLHTIDNIEPTAVTLNSFKYNDQLDLNLLKAVEKLEMKKNVIGKVPTTVKIINKHNAVEEVKTELPLLKITEGDKVVEIRHEPPQPVEPQEEVDDSQKEKKKADVEAVAILPAKKEKPLELEKTVEKQQSDNIAVVDSKAAMNHNKTELKNDEVDIEAIKKEDKEVELQEKEKTKQDDTNKVLIDTIQKQNEVQKEIVEQQKKLLEVIKNQQQKEVKDFQEEKLAAFKRIKNIAVQAMEEISAVKDSDKVLADLEKKFEGNVDQQLKQKVLDEIRQEKNNQVNEIQKGNMEDLKKGKDDVPSIDLGNLARAQANDNNVVLVENVADKKESLVQPLPKNNEELVKSEMKAEVSEADVKTIKVVEIDENKNQEKIDMLPKKIVAQVGPDNKEAVSIKKMEAPAHSNNSINDTLNNKYNNTAPLFLKLGRSEVKITHDEKPGKMIPLPIAVSNHLNKNSNSVNLTKSDTLPSQKVFTIEDINKISLEDHEEIQAIRRDILAITTKR